jgi:hypothetical protein
MKIRADGAELFCVERQRETDGLSEMSKLKIAFTNYTNAPNVNLSMLFREIFTVCPQMHA